MWNAQVFGWNSLGSFGGGENTPSGPPDRGCPIGGKPRGGLPPYIDFLRFSLHNMAIIESLMFLYLWSFPSSMPEMVFKLFKHHHEKLPTKFFGDKIAFFLGFMVTTNYQTRIREELGRSLHGHMCPTEGLSRWPSFRLALQDFLETIQRLQLLYVTGFNAFLGRSFLPLGVWGDRIVTEKTGWMDIWMLI